jgi:N-acetylglucosaminyldiphosphoundecaprenol N-acetyl-beta-D-mannosaminyltransferase
MEICALRMDELLGVCEEHIGKRSSLLLGIVNVAKLVNCCKNAELHKSLTEADIVLADGLPIVWLSKLIGDPLPERVTGIDIMHRLLESSSKKHYRVFFLGAEKAIVQNVVQIVEKEYPGLIIAGYRDGYFKESESENVAEEIRKSSADIIFVAMSSPKKENFLRKWRNFINVPICHGVGGSFDVLAGVTRRAPLWMQKCGMEWFYRLVQEPKRMWRRYLVTNMVFIKLSIEAIIQARLSKLLNRFRLTRASNIKEHD